MIEPMGEYRSYAPGDFTPGLTRRHAFTLGRDDIEAFAAVSGDRHPLHADVAQARSQGLPDTPVHGMLVASRASAFIAHDFVGVGGLLVSMSADFRQPVYCDEELVWSGEVERVVAEAGTVEIRWRVTNARDAVVQRGAACAWLPPAG